jgi:putative ABC transport system permease protein
LQAQATGPRYASDRAVFDNHDRLREAVRAVPGVAGVGIASQLPLGGNVDGYGVAAEDKPLANPELAPSADRYAVSPDFMATMRIRLLRGRGFTDADGRDSTAAPVAIVSAALAARIWPGEDAIGKRIRLGGPTRPWLTVVGVAGNVRHSGLDAAVTNQVYVPERQWPWAESQVAVVVRTASTVDAAAIAPAVRSAVQSVDPSQPVTRLATMDQVVAASTAQRRLALVLFAAFAGAAIVLAGAGIYGVLAGSVAERTREIGLRSALGATPRDIVLLVLRQGARLAAVGVAIGVAGALGLGRFIAGLLYGVRPSDPLTLGAVAAALALVAVAACWVPAWRAVRVEAMEALRSE